MNKAVPAAPPSRALEFTLLALSALGLGISVYLVLVHAGMGGQICDLSETVSCDKVAASPWSVLLGVPLAAWGALAYLAVGAISALAARRDAPHPGFGGGLLVVATGLMSATAVFLAYVSEVLIGALCLFCAGSWLTSFALLFASWRLARRAGGVGPALRADLAAVARRAMPFAALAGVLALLAAGLFAGYRLARPHIAAAGATEPLVVLEFSDYECPVCARMHRDNKDLVAKNPWLRLERRHFPLDDACNPIVKRPFHVGSCELSRAALCADAQGRFKAMDDALFANQESKVPVDALAGQVGLDLDRFRACMTSPDTAARLQADLSQGVALKVRATPSYVVDGKVYAGNLAEAIAQHQQGDGQKQN